MGALHDGHLSLVKKAREKSDHVIVSTFVNPTQFGPNEDYLRYPRHEKEDLALLEQAGVDVAYLPEASAMYAPGAAITVEP
jgi:pantoate--beta-alanine ligase